MDLLLILTLLSSFSVKYTYRFVMNKIVGVLVLSVVFAVTKALETDFALEVDYAPIINDPTVEEVVEGLNLMDEVDNVPSVSFEDVPRFSYLENSNAVEADAELEAEIEAGVGHTEEVEEQEDFSLLETGAEAELDAELDQEMDMEMETEQEMEEELAHPTVVINPTAVQSSIPNAIIVSAAPTVPFEGYTEVKLPEIPRNATVKAQIIPLAVPPSNPKSLADPVTFTPADALATLTFRLLTNRQDYWKDPANFKWQLTQDIAQVIKAPARRVKILNIDPHVLTVTVAIKQAFIEDLANQNATIHAELLARNFYNFQASRQYGNYTILSAIDPKFAVKYTVEKVRMPLVAGIPARIKVGANVRAVSGNIGNYLKDIQTDIAKVAGVKENQVVITSVQPYGGVSLSSFVVEFRVTSRPDTFADEEVNPMTALATLKRAMDDKNSALYKTSTLKDIDAAYPLQKNMNEEPLVPYKSWVEDPREYQTAPLYMAKPDLTHKPIIIPSILVAAPVNQTVSYPEKVAVTI